jgi:hypothetical protein
MSTVERNLTVDTYCASIVIHFTMFERYIRHTLNNLYVSN